MKRIMIIAVLAVLSLTATAQTWMTNSTSWTCDVVGTCSDRPNATRTVDGSLAQYWAGAPTGWVLYQFPTPVTLTDFRLNVYGSPSPSGLVKFEYHNGSGFVTLTSVPSIPANTTGWVQLPSFAPVTATMWRLTVTGVGVYEVNFGTSCTPSTYTQSITECVSWTSPTGTVHTQSGTYADTLQNSCGMDSVITTNLTINTVDVSVTQNGATLTSNAQGASVGWLSCPSMTWIQPGQSYTATQNGSYACVVYQNACWDTSECYDVVITEVQHAAPKTDAVTLYPNPTTGDVNISGAGDNPQVTVYDMTGRAVLASKSSVVRIERPGMYVVDVNGGRHVIVVTE
jgi:hypothetical protein